MDRRALVMVFFSLTTLAYQAHAQRLPPPLAPPAARFGTVAPSYYVDRGLSLDTFPRRHTTGLERYLWSLGTGTLASVAAHAIANPKPTDSSTLITAGGFVAGATLGTGLVTSAHEGASPLGLALGSGAAALLGVLVAPRACTKADCGDAGIPGAGWIAFGLILPLVIEVVHGRFR